jgi:ankyrin repeat protein
LRDIPSVLNYLPKTLDETYERILQGIPERMQSDAHRIFQWLTVSSRPLRVEELAEVFTMDFDEEISGIPRFDPSWRHSNAEASVLCACSTLVSVVQDTNSLGMVTGKKHVQFAHFSIKEYLISGRIANSALVSHLHILPKTAHTLLAKACLSTLIQLDDSIDETKIQNFPLAEYAAEHWVDHTRFEDVSLDLQNAMDCLFDRNKPHLAAWIWLYNVEDGWMLDNDDRSPHPTQPDAVPLYYAALCGIRDLVERLLDTHPQDLNTQGGYFETPLLAALEKGHRNVALFLLERGADVQARVHKGQTALYMASSRGYTELVRSLLDHGAGLNAECYDWDKNGVHVKFTPLLVASHNNMLEIARLLLEQGANPNYQDNFSGSALHLASRHPSIDVTRLLLDHGANPDEVDNDGKTALHYASAKGKTAFVALLLKYGVNVDAQNEERSIDSASQRSQRRTFGTRAAVARPRRQRERTKERSLVRVACGSMQWIPPSCGGLIGAWRRSACAER